MDAGAPMIGLLGATGYTGRLVAAELVARGVPHRLGGRSADRLAALPASPLADTAVVDTGDPGALRAFLAGLDAVISCVGPFSSYGLPVMEAVVESRTPYVDSTGEPDFIRRVYDRYADAPCPLVPACGFDYIPGDLAVAIAIEELGTPATAVDVGYELTGGAVSRGTMLSALGVVGTAHLSGRRLRIEFPDGTRTAVEIPWGEQVTVPRHAPGARVASGIVVPQAAANAVSLMAPLLSLSRPVLPLLAAAVRPLVERRPEGPSEQVRAAARFRIVARASAGERSARVLVEGADVYGLTARFLVEAALRVAGPDAPTGALAPAQVLPPRAFLDATGGPDLRWRVL
ncbi:MAG: NAD(P)H-binding protein [Actinomycetota bacterium]|nr:NAD(P)H-binding protein [Actinomycetota bacterium]